MRSNCNNTVNRIKIKTKIFKILYMILFYWWCLFNIDQKNNIDESYIFYSFEFNSWFGQEPSSFRKELQLVWLQRPRGRQLRQCYSKIPSYLYFFVKPYMHVRQHISKIILKTHDHEENSSPKTTRTLTKGALHDVYLTIKTNCFSKLRMQQL